MANNDRVRRKPGPKPTPATERFWRYVNKSDDGCWLWTGSIDGVGYGRIGGRSQREILAAHRLSYEMHKGPIDPPSLFVCHTCDVRHCVNPDHLFLGTHTDNMRDMRAKGRGTFGMRHGTHILTDEQVLEIREAVGTCEELGRKYGVSGSNIHLIKTGKSWKHLTGETP